MRIIGLTGGTGSGKGVVSDILRRKGAKIIDSDKIAHDIILKGKPAYDEIVGYFGKGILGTDGEIIRKRLGEMVFLKNSENLQFLNQCTHKYIYEEIEEHLNQYEKMGEKCVVIDAPLLLEGDFKNLCQEIWVVYADEKTRCGRIVERDRIDESVAEGRIAAQKTWEEYKKFADVILFNDKDIRNLEEQVEKYYV